VLDWFIWGNWKAAGRRRTDSVARHRLEYSASLCKNITNPTPQHNTMPPRLNIPAFTRSIAFRPRPQAQWPARSALRLAPSQCRLYSDSTKTPAADRSKREDAKPIEHVSEEAASMAKTMGEKGPDLNQGTPIEDVRSFVAHTARRRLTMC
jgi:hypothetical protein